MSIPPKGFYIHYKHDPKGTAHNYMYEVVGIARNTEEKTYSVLYRPLYANDLLPPADVHARPLEMFLENVEKDGVIVPRFSQITDHALIATLETVRDRIYK